MSSKAWGYRFLTLILAGLLMSCSGGDTDGGSAAGDNPFEDGGFNSDGTSTGRITLEVNADGIAVADTAGFIVTVRDAEGNPVPQVRVTCDTELGVAIVEPTTGSELTSSQGVMSGRIGCAAPGSFQMACRLPIGANKRAFADIHCTGDVPGGFEGFPGTAGGGLGGGVDDSGDGQPGGTNSGAVRITSATASEGTDEATTSIDVVQGACQSGDGGQVEAEPFYDTHVKFKVENNSNSTVRFTRLNYQITLNGVTHTSHDIALVAEALPNGGETPDFTVLLFKALNGFKYITTAANQRVQIPVDLGFANVRLTLTGTNDLGEEVTPRGSIALSFSNFNRCEE